MFKLRHKDVTLNQSLARKVTLVFGSMWVFYLFFIYGLLPLIPGIQPYEPILLYWSNWVQLWSLPLIMVGQQVLGKDTEIRDKETHDASMAELLSAREEVEMLKTIIKEQNAATLLEHKRSKEESELLKKIVQEIHTQLGCKSV